MIGENLIMLIIVFIIKFGLITSNEETLDKEMNKALNTEVKESGFTEFEEETFLRIFNSYRSNYFPSGGNMYKLTWIDWKSNVKTKALQLRKEMSKTGGGPQSENKLTSIEEKLLNLIGWVNVEGSNFIEEAGLGSQVWNEELSKIAKNWSDQCSRESYKLKHCDKLTSLDHFAASEILYIFSNIPLLSSYGSAFLSWIMNATYYNHTSNTCTRGCITYKTFVQAEYHSVGCSKSHCGEFIYITCNFYPRIRNLTERPYDSGNPCSRCGLDDDCDKELELCVKNDPHVPIEEYSKCERIPSTHKSSSRPIYRCSNNEKLIFILMGTIVLLLLLLKFT